MSEGRSRAADRASDIMDAGGFRAGGLALASMFGLAVLAYAVKWTWMQALTALLGESNLSIFGPWISAALAFTLVKLAPMVLLLLAALWMYRRVRSEALGAFLFVGLLFGASELGPRLETVAEVLPARALNAFGVLTSAWHFIGIATLVLLVGFSVVMWMRRSRTAA